MDAEGDDRADRKDGIRAASSHHLASVRGSGDPAPDPEREGRGPVDPRTLLHSASLIVLCVNSPCQLLKQLCKELDYYISFMRKNKSTLYFEKRYCLLVHSLTLTQRISLTAFSLHSAEQETIDRSSTYSLNQIVYLSCVDLVCDGTTTPDSQVDLGLRSRVCTSPPWGHASTSAMISQRSGST